MRTGTLYSVVCAAGLMISQSAGAIVVDLYSGNGAVGGADSQITYLQGPIDSAFPGAFTAADFAAARAGSAAQIINRNAAWITTGAFAATGGNPAAQWISDNANGAGQGSTALYAIDFVNPFAAVQAASMDFYWAVDNVLGDATNAGLFLNGLPIAVSGGGLGFAAGVLGVNVSSLLVSGTNTLYLNAIDLGGPGGFLFSASINITEDTGGGGNPGGGSVPLPATLGLLLFGLAAVGARRRG